MESQVFISSHSGFNENNELIQEVTTGNTSGERDHSLADVNIGTKGNGYPIRNKHGFETVLLEEGWHSQVESHPKGDYQLWFEKIAPEKDMNSTGFFSATTSTIRSS